MSTLWLACRALLLIAGLCTLWLWVQRRWLGEFGDEGQDDALANSGGGRGCTCAGGACRRQPVKTENDHAP